MRRQSETLVTLISDATGSLGEHALHAIFTQFLPGTFSLRTISFVHSNEALTRCLAALEHAQGLVIHAVISRDAKRRINETCRAQGLAVYDLTGPIVAFIQEASGHEPQIDYQRLHALDTEYFKRVKAIEFAIEHDDAGGLRTLRNAEVILTGISRTTKTPTNIVLATHGIRAANIPLVRGIDPPKELLAADAERVICLTLDPRDVTAFRSARAQEELGFDGGYADSGRVREELTWARQFSDRQGWRTLDVTGRAIEENAARIMQMLKGREPEGV